MVTCVFCMGSATFTVQILLFRMNAIFVPSDDQAAALSFTPLLVSGGRFILHGTGGRVVGHGDDL